MSIQCQKARILEIKVLCKEPGRYIGWPTIAKTNSGELITVFSGDRDRHVCMSGKTQLVRSKDNGKTWSEPVTITNTPLDDRDAGIINLPTGVLILSWFTSYHHPDDPSHSKKPDRDKWRPFIEKLSEQDKSKWLCGLKDNNKYKYKPGSWIKRSKDNGYTWEEPKKVTASAPHGPIELSDGSLLYIGNGYYNKEECIVWEKSGDKGKTWKVGGAFNASEVDGRGGFLCEPHAVEVEPNRIVAMFRYERKTGEKVDSARRKWCVLWQAESTDGGKTWNKPYETEIWGKPPHLIKLKDGRILVTYGHRREPYGERACFSYDGGKTWDYKNEIILSETERGDLGYPSSLELDDGTIATVYYEKDNPDEKPCLKATFWK